MQDRRAYSLLCRVGPLLCALPLQHVQETMRPLPVEAITGVPSYVRGLALVRGIPTPVVDARSLICGETSHATRFVTVKTGGRCVALAVDAVVGVVEIPADSLDALPVLFKDANPDVISALGTLDDELLLVLRGTRLIPEESWAALEADCVPA